MLEHRVLARTPLSRASPGFQKSQLPMKTNVLLLCLFLPLSAATVCAQGTAFTYQGRLNDGAAPAGGIYDLRFTIYDSSGGPAVVAGPLTNSATAVSNGLFTATLDFGAGVFTGANRWLEIGVRTNGAGAFVTLTPRRPLTPSPYAIYSANSAVAATANGVAPGSVTGAGIAAGTITAANIGNGQVIKSLNGLTDNVTISPGAGIGITGIGNGLLISSVAWNQAGNTGTSPTNGNFLGTIDFQPLELRVNGQRALRLEPVNDSNHSNIVNVVNGSSVNSAASGTMGATIGGGGAGNFFGVPYSNSVSGDFGTVSGGFGNTIQSNSFAATIAGGNGNTIQSAGGATISGGQANTIEAGADFSSIVGIGNNIRAASYRSTVGGGFNTIEPSSYDSTIAGGAQNTIQRTAFWSTIGGGNLNVISSNASRSTIVGGYGNIVLSNATYATISGGIFNRAGPYSFAAGSRAEATNQGTFVWADTSDFVPFSSVRSNEFAVRALGGARFVTGGAGLTVDGAVISTVHTTTDIVNRSNMVNVVNGSSVNSVAAGVRGATISGGGAGNYDGVAYTNSIAADLGTIAGGAGNTIQSLSDGAAIGGGSRNKVLGAFNAAIAGGADNTIQNGASSAFIGGGQFNNIQAFAGYTAIGGGLGNVNSGLYSAIAGGNGNSTTGNAAAIGGGSSNTAGQEGTVAGGSFNNAGLDAAIAGGVQNTNSGFAGAIGGGTQNTIRNTSQFSVIAGGTGNTISDGNAATIAGGAANTVRAFEGSIGGGQVNTIQVSADHSTIGGGGLNTIVGSGLLAVYSTISGGRRNSTQTNAVYATIGGGFTNTILAESSFATISGGASNTITGSYGTVAGGDQNTAGTNSLAAGHRARALHTGSFVWSDATEQDFASTGTNQFLIRATGGVGINTNNPAGAALNVVGTVKATAFQGDGSGLSNVSAGALGNYLFAYTTGLQIVGAGSVFQDITLTTDGQINGWTHILGSAQYTNTQAGLYLIHYDAQASSTAATGTNVSVRVALNGVEVPGSQSSSSIATSFLQVVPLSKSFIASVNASDALTLQFTGSSPAVRLVNAGSGSTRPSVSLTITRIQ
jgi:BclA C-terminal domain